MSPALEESCKMGAHQHPAQPNTCNYGLPLTPSLPTLLPLDQMSLALKESRKMAEKSYHAPKVGLG